MQHLGRYEDIGLTPEEIMTRLSAQETTIDVPAFDQIMADIFTTEKKE